MRASSIASPSVQFSACSFRPGLDGGGRTPVRIAGVAGRARAYIEVGGAVCDRAASIGETQPGVRSRRQPLASPFSGTRSGQQVPVSIFRVRPDGTRETFSSGIVNPTSMAIDLEGRSCMCRQPRFERRRVLRACRTDPVDAFASDISGVACGLAFAPDGTLFVGGSGSGTIFRRVSPAIGSRVAVRVGAVERGGVSSGDPRRTGLALYVTGPTLASYDAVYRIDRGGVVKGAAATGFGGPQGIAVDDARGHAVRRRSARRNDAAASIGFQLLQDPPDAPGAPELAVSWTRIPSRRRVRSPRRSRRSRSNETAPIDWPLRLQPADPGGYLRPPAQPRRRQRAVRPTGSPGVVVDLRARPSTSAAAAP